MFGDRYFIEIQNNGVEIQRLAMEAAVEVANQMGLPLVATSDAHYVDREDAEAQDVLLCINTGKFRTDTEPDEDGGRPVLPPQRRRRCTPRCPTTKRRVGRSQQIADSVDIDLELGKRHFPDVPRRPSRRPPHDYLRELCLGGSQGALRRRRRIGWTTGGRAFAGGASSGSIANWA